MSVEEIKDMIKSFGKAWILSPIAVFETCDEVKNRANEVPATTSLSVYKQYYK